MPLAMFEGGKISRCGDALSDAQGDGAALKRELRWAELVAQLAATRDLRGEQGRKAGEAKATGRFMSLNAGFADASAPPPGGGFVSGTSDEPHGQRLAPSMVTHRTSRKDRETS